MRARKKRRKIIKNEEENKKYILRVNGMHAKYHTVKTLNIGIDRPLHSVDPDQMPSERGVWSVLTLFAV